VLIVQIIDCRNRVFTRACAVCSPIRVNECNGDVMSGTLEFDYSVFVVP
jgi:hypothetical protein